MNDNFDIFNNVAESLSNDSGIDIESSRKVVTWLINEGILDMPVVNDQFTEVA